MNNIQKQQTIDLRIKKNKELLIEQLKKIPIVQVVCEKTGVSRSSYYRWRKENKEFRKQTDKAIFEGILFINDLAESQLISSIKDKHMTGIIFWLKNRHKGYKDKVEVTTKSKGNNKLTSEQEALIKQALNLASLTDVKKDEKEKTK